MANVKNPFKGGGKKAKAEKQPTKLPKGTGRMKNTFSNPKPKSRTLQTGV